MTKLRTTTADGLILRNPLLVGSGPPSATFESINKARLAGFAGAVIKTVSPDDEPIINVAPRYGKLRGPDGSVIGFENIELIATEELAVWVDTVKRLKDLDPEFIVIVSFMAPCDKPEKWLEMIEMFSAVGCDGFEINASCPHGFGNRKMGAAIGENPEICGDVARIVSGGTKKPVWLKLTPNVLPHAPARAALSGGATGISAINTVRCVIDVDLDALQPCPKVSGTKVTTTGGYSGPAVLPIALARVNDSAHVIHDEFQGKATLSGIGGIVDWQSAAKHLLLGAETVQICTGIMLSGFTIAGPILEGLERYMESKGIADMSGFSGLLRDSVVSFGEVQRQYTDAKSGVVRDRDWNADQFVAQVTELS